MTTETAALALLAKALDNKAQATATDRLTQALLDFMDYMRQRHGEDAESAPMVDRMTQAIEAIRLQPPPQITVSPVIKSEPGQKWQIDGSTPLGGKFSMTITKL